MKYLAAALVLVLGLMACTNPAIKTVTFAAQGGSTASGTASIEKLATGGFKTILTLKGLTPSTEYFGHYHNKGTAGTGVCDSAGGIANASLFAKTLSDASGNLTLEYTNTTVTDFANMGAYINVHQAATVPLCADVTGLSF